MLLCVVCGSMMQAEAEAKAETEALVPAAVQIILDILDKILIVQSSVPL